MDSKLAGVAEVKAFVTPFIGWLVRVGPEAEKFGDPYLYTCPVEWRDGVWTLVAYPNPPPTPEALKAAARAFAAMGYGEIAYERLGENGRVVRLFTEDGVTIMRHEKINAPHVRDTPRDHAGKPDWQTIKAVTLAMIDQVDSGHYTMDDGGQVDSANGSHDDERALMKAMRGLKSNQRLLWCVRGETVT